MIENEFWNNLFKVISLCGWQAAPLEIEPCEEMDNQIYVYSDIHPKAIEENMLYSSLNNIIAECEDLFGDKLADSEIMENGDENISPYRLALRISIDTHEKREADPA